MARLASLSVHTPAVVAMPTFDRLLEAATITVAEAAMLVVLAAASVAAVVDSRLSGRTFGIFLQT
jgi:hypothetical protein